MRRRLGDSVRAIDSGNQHPKASPKSARGVELMLRCGGMRSSVDGIH